MPLRPAQPALLFAIGAAGGLVGDAAHVLTGTTTYLDEGVPFIWESALWFPLAVGAATALTADLRLRLGPARADGDLGETVAAIASVLAIYALTALFADEAEGATTILIVMLAALVAVRFGGGRPALICAALAATLGPAAEIAIVEAELAAYAPTSDGLFGVALWLPALYFAFGIVVSRLAELAATGRMLAAPPR